MLPDARRNPPLDNINFMEQHDNYNNYACFYGTRNNPGKTTCWRLLNQGVPPVDESCPSMPKWESL